MKIQKTIGIWGDRVFGPVRDPAALVHRAQQELEELKAAVEAGGTFAIGDEIADVVILLYRLADRCGLDLDLEVERKNVRNQARKWASNGDGTGTHIAD